MIERTGCDAVMIGRMAPSNPWIFRQIAQYNAWADDAHVGAGGPTSTVEQSSAAPGELGFSPPDEDVRGCVRGGGPYEQPTEADRYDMIHTYFRMLIEEELPDAQGKMKQFASWFTQSKSAPEILLRVEEFFSPVLQPA